MSLYCYVMSSGIHGSGSTMTYKGDCDVKSILSADIHVCAWVRSVWGRCTGGRGWWSVWGPCTGVWGVWSLWGIMYHVGTFS